MTQRVGTGGETAARTEDTGSWTGAPRAVRSMAVALRFRFPSAQPPGRTR